MLTSLFADLSPALAVSISASLTDAIESVYGFLTEFAKRDDFFDKSEFVFGQTLDRRVLSELRDQWVVGDFSKLPDVKLLSASDLQGANGAFAGSTGEIYLSTGFLSQYVGTPQVLAAVLLEEVGHSVDWKVNAVDAVGDEGELFSAVLRGVDLSPAEVQRMKTENDSVILNLGTNLFKVEQSLPSGFDVKTLAYSEWNNTEITYSFINNDSDDLYVKEVGFGSGISPLPENIQDDIKTIFRDVFGTVIPISFKLIDKEKVEDQFDIGDIGGGFSSPKTTEYGMLRFMYSKHFDSINTHGAAFKPDWWTGDLDKKKGDVYFNQTSWQFSTYEGKGSGEYETMIHEIGHALGLKHPHEDKDHEEPFLGSSEYMGISKSNEKDKQVI